MAKITAIREPDNGKFRYPVAIPNGFSAVSFGDTPVFMNEADRNWTVAELINRNTEKESIILEFITKDET